MAVKYASKEEATEALSDVGAFFQMKRQLRINEYMVNYHHCEVIELDDK
jgi:hypothetical protein